jgi:hypothetical protein
VPNLPRYVKIVHATRFSYRPTLGGDESMDKNRQNITRTASADGTNVNST